MFWIRDFLLWLYENSYDELKKEKMIYGWWIVIAILINISLLGPAAVALTNIFQTSVAIEFAISNSALAINNVIVLGIGIFVSSIVSKNLSGSHFNKTYLMGIISSIIGLVSYSISQIQSSRLKSILMLMVMVNQLNN